MDPEALKKAEAQIREVVDSTVRTAFGEEIGKERAAVIEAVVKELRLQRLVSGRDITGLDDAQKKAFIDELRNIANNKAALLSNSDQAGGYLVPQEVASGILRIAETVGLVARDARRWGSADIEIPLYTGAALQGEFVGEDGEGDESNVEFEQAKLVSKTWMVILRVGNKLLAKANVDLADWLMSLVAEGLAYRLDREGFVGGTFVGSPFVGLLNDNSGVAAHTMTAGKTGFEDFDIVEASDVIGSIPTAALQGAAFYFNRTVWAKIRSKSTSGIFEFEQTNMLMALRKETGLQPAGEILGYPVYVTDVLPAYSASAISTKFGVFGNLSLALFYGVDGPMQIMKSEHATVGGKSLLRANQVAWRFTQELGLAPGLTDAAVAIKTPAA